MAKQVTFRQAAPGEKPPVYDEFYRRYPAEILLEWATNVSGFRDFLEAHPQREKAYWDARVGHQLLNQYLAETPPPGPSS